MLGEPGNRSKQMAVLRDTLAALTGLSEPGASVVLPYRWEASPVMWAGKALREGPYS